MKLESVQLSVYTGKYRKTKGTFKLQYKEKIQQNPNEFYRKNWYNILNSLISSKKRKTLKINAGIKRMLKTILTKHNVWNIFGFWGNIIIKLCIYETTENLSTQWIFEIFIVIL